MSFGFRLVPLIQLLKVVGVRLLCEGHADKDKAIQMEKLGTARNPQTKFASRIFTNVSRVKAKVDGRLGRRE
ncbi:MAG: hypothetical protein Q9177_002943 [Variospora cf. flavescens]